MFIAIIGTRQAGKSTVEDYLVRSKGFLPVRLKQEQNAEENHSLENALSMGTSSALSGGIALLRLATPSRAYSRDSFLVLNSPVSPHFPTDSTELSEPEARCLEFSSPELLLQHITQNWRSNFVTCDLVNTFLVEPFLIRPFFMLINVDAPLYVRYKRSRWLNENASSLDDFVRENDQCLYGSSSLDSMSQAMNAPSLLNLNEHVQLRIINSFKSISAFHAYLDRLDLIDQERLRPGWDAYFMQLATLASLRSNCMKRRVGAILVRNKRILATGYNGTPRGVTNCNEGGCYRCNNASEASDECVCLHAEENALLEAGRERVGDGAVLYCNTCPCLKCTIKIIQTGVKEVVYNLSYKVDDASAAMFHEAGVLIRRHIPPAQGRTVL